MKSRQSHRNFWLFVLCLAVIGLTKPVKADSTAWTSTGSLNIARRQHTATLLGNGQVLVTGGIGVGGARASSELYDPTTGTWSLTNPMSMGRYGYTATLLQNGKVLVAGGGPDMAGTLASAEVYDPLTGQWTTTGSMVHARFNHSATLLPDGKVLVVGGTIDSYGTILSSAELYDPVNGLWTEIAPLAQGRYYHTATLLPSGKVLVVDGYTGNVFSLATAELFDSATGSWITVSSPIWGRYQHTATLLTDGTVLVAGGYFGNTPLGTTELYNPVTDTWTAKGNFTELAGGRAVHTATLLPNGQVLATGGNSGSGNTVLISTELYDPTTGLWASAGAMTENRTNHTATLMQNGQVLVVGGSNPYNPINSLLATAELLGVSQPQDQTIQVTIHAPANAQVGQQFTVSATASSGLSVIYSASGACTNTGATFTMTSGVGTCTVQYDQPGDATYKPASQVVEIVEDANDPPTALYLSATSVVGNMPAGTAVGSFSSVDADSGDTFTYSLVSGTGSADNPSFTIVGDQLQTAAVFDSATKNSYAIRVRTTDSGSGNLSFEQTFTITVTPNNYTPSLLTPINAEQLLNNRPTFDWTDVPGAISYRIQIYRSGDFSKSSKVVNTTTTLSTYSSTADLPANSTLYWRVQINTATGTGPWSAIRTFMTANPPSIPNLLSPKNNAKNINLTPVLDWTDSIIPAGTAFQEYELQLSVNSGFSSPIVVHITTGAGDSSVSLNEKGIFLSANTKYYWRVRTFNNLGQYNSWSTVFSFTTLK